MALSAASPFASFDVTDGSQERDISPVLAEALYYDLHLLSAINVDFGSPIQDTKFYWNEDILNADTVTVSGSVTSVATAITLASGHGARLVIGDLLYLSGVSGATEILQLTAFASADVLTVTRAYNSTTKGSLADAATLARIPAAQEGSDIGNDGSVAPRVRSNFTQIMWARDLQVTGSQLARKMATSALQDFVGHELANRATELRISMSRAALYGEPSSSAGSDSVYRSTQGIRSWIQAASGVTNSSATALTYANLNTLGNKPIVDLGLYPDTLVIGTDLVASVAGYDSTSRRLLESDTQAGYHVQTVTMNHGNDLRVIVDGRVNTGDAFLFDSSKITYKPLDGRGMFVIAAVDFTDARKRRIGGEWGLEFRNPEAAAYLSAKT